MGIVGRMKAAAAALLERRRFESLAREPCDASALGALDERRLAALLADAGAAASWAADAGRFLPIAPPDGTGGVNPGDRRAIYTLVHQLAPRSVLEIGTHIGASTAAFALALRRAGKGVLTTVDIADVNDPLRGRWRELGAKLSPRELVEELGCGGQVRFERADSVGFLDAPGDPFDFIFLDGDHAARAVYRELPRALRRLRPGGYVLLHDYFPEGRPLWPAGGAIKGPWLGARRLEREGAALRVLPLGKLPWPTKLGTNLTSLALVAAR